MAVKQEGLRSLLQMLPALLEMIQTWGPKLMNSPFSSEMDASPRPQPTTWGCTSSPSGSPGAATCIPPISREGANGGCKGKGKQACFEQKDKEAKMQMKHYHFKGEKIDNNVSHHPANNLQPPQPAEAVRSLPSFSSSSSSSSSFPSYCLRSCLFMIRLMTKQLIKGITQLSS